MNRRSFIRRATAAIAGLAVARTLGTATPEPVAPDVVAAPTYNGWPIVASRDMAYDQGFIMIAHPSQVYAYRALGYDLKTFVEPPLRSHNTKALDQ